MYSSHFYYDILFDHDDHVCWSNNPYGVRVQPLEPLDIMQDVHEFVSINPFKPETTRKDANVSKYRNILLEFDSGTIEEQKKLIRELNIPYSTIVFSGSKSLHVVISLEKPLETKEAYDALVRRVYAKVPQADQSGKNCSRFTRAPNAIRDNGNRQELLHYRYRIPLAQLETWLGPELKTEQPIERKPDNNVRLLKGSTWYFLANGAPTGEWNRKLFLAALDMLRSGYNEEDTLKHLYAVTGTLDRNDKRTIQSAINIRKQEKSS